MLNLGIADLLSRFGGTYSEKPSGRAPCPRVWTMIGVVGRGGVRRRRRRSGNRARVKVTSGDSVTNNVSWKREGSLET